MENSVEQMVEDFNEKFKPGDVVMYKSTGGGIWKSARVSAQAELVVDRPIVALEDAGYFDLEFFEWETPEPNSVPFSEQPQYEKTFEDDNEDSSILGDVAGAMIADEGIAATQDTAEDSQKFNGFGGGDFGGGGSEGSWGDADKQASDEDTPQGDNQADDSQGSDDNSSDDNNSPDDSSSDDSSSDSSSSDD